MKPNYSKISVADFSTIFKATPVDYASELLVVCAKGADLSRAAWLRTRARTPARGGFGRPGGRGLAAAGVPINMAAEDRARRGCRYARLISSNRRPNASLPAQSFCPPLPAPRDSKLSLKRL